MQDTIAENSQAQNNAQQDNAVEGGEGDATAANQANDNGQMEMPGELDEDVLHGQSASMIPPKDSAHHGSMPEEQSMISGI